ncbi:MAG: glycosyltransferase family 4 protein [Pseudomonadota bacterium]
MILATLLLAWVLTWAMRRFALSRNLLDIPNARSSHQVATPRGGGAAIVLAFSALVVLCFALGLTSAKIAAALLLGGAVVAIAGFMDDRSPLSPRVRLLAHASAGLLAVLLLGAVPGLPLPGGFWAWGWFGVPLSLVGVIWCINLYNFMDGIDGLAAVEAVCLALGAQLALFAIGADVSPLLLGWAAAALGYLYWNWPPAKIFMGDVGSGWLGFLIAAFLLLTGPAGLNAWVWLILFAVFLVDANWTLMVRWRRGEKLSDAHRNHSYQKASRLAGGHRPVTITVVLINVFWLWPLAAAAALYPAQGLWLALLAMLPLLWLAMHYRGGVPDTVSAQSKPASPRAHSSSPEKS